MGQTYTRWSKNTTSITGSLHIQAQDSFQAPNFVFVFPNGDYFSQTSAQASNETYILAGTQALFVVNAPLLVQNDTYPADNGEFFNALDETIAFTRTTIEQGVYYFSATQGSDIEQQYVIMMPDIEEAMVTLAQKLLDTQCACQMNRSVMDNYIKAKAMQQLIYSKVADQGVTLSTTFLADVNADVTVLHDFMQGTSEICGC